MTLTRLGGLHFEKKVWTMETPDSLTRTLNNKRGYKIPLGWTYIYVMYIYTHLRKAGIVKVQRFIQTQLVIEYTNQYTLLFFVKAPFYDCIL